MHRFTKYERILILLFFLTLPLSNPWVRGDGVGYYAFGRAMLIGGNLDFTKDWLDANSSFRMGRVGPDGNINQNQFTVTGHLDNHFTIGPAILWAPFLVTAHLFVEVVHIFGSQVSADGFSSPYRIAMALGTAFYGFLGIWFSFLLAKKYCGEKWAFLGALGVWFASSLPVYMYFNPFWAHAHSAFVVALFLWYWDRTRTERSVAQWLILGAIAGLMMDVYYISGVLLIVPLMESLAGYWDRLKAGEIERAKQLFVSNVVFVIAILVTFFPTLITKKIIYGGYFNFGYTERWFWKSPALLKVCFSAEHGLFSWTPILILSVAGLFLLRRYDRDLAFFLTGGFLVYLYAIGCYENWAGISSFGNRFFISLTPMFVLGLASFFGWVASKWRERQAAAFAWSVTALFVLWNMGLIFQWGTHLIPARGPVSWHEVAYNQVAVVPEQSMRTVKAYLTRRGRLMEHLEQQDMQQLKEQNKKPANTVPTDDNE
ncbi:MAG: glycosyltransferase family 39 protein [Candidatus Acidiferrales bacterium]